MRPLTSCFILCAIFASSAVGLDYEGIEENYTCDSDKYPIDPNFDPAWMGPVPFWYIPIWNKVDYYQNAEDFFGPEEFAKLTEDDLKRTCVYYKPNGTSVPIYGFDGKILNYEAFPDPIRPGLLYYSFNGSDENRKFHATSYTTLTDKKSYFFAVTLWANGLKGFNVGATTPQLDEKVLSEVKQHAIDLGFKEEFFVENDYTICPPPPPELMP